MQASNRVTLTGFSYGGRIVASGLHLLGGGILAGHTVENASPTVAHPHNIRAVLLAPAMDCDWLLPGRRLGNSLSMADKFLLVYNSLDSALKRYRWVSPARSQALGFTGLSSRSRLGQYRERFQQINVANIMRRTHDWYLYQRSSRILSRIADYTFSGQQDNESPTAATVVPEKESPSKAFSVATISN